MTALVFGLALAGFVCFVVETVRTASLLAAGLALVTLAWIINEGAPW